MNDSKATSRYSAGDARSDVSEKTVGFGKHVVLGSAGHLPRRALRFTLPASSKPKRATRSVPRSVITFRANLPGLISMMGRRAVALRSPSGARASERALGADVHVFEILAKNDEVDTARIGERTLRAGKPTRGPNVRVGLLAPAQVEERERTGAAVEPKSVASDASMASRATGGNG